MTRLEPCHRRCHPETNDPTRPRGMIGSHLRALQHARTRRTIRRERRSRRRGCPIPSRGPSRRAPRPRRTTGTLRRRPRSPATPAPTSPTDRRHHIITATPTNCSRTSSARSSGMRLPRRSRASTSHDQPIRRSRRRSERRFESWRPPECRHRKLPRLISMPSRTPCSTSPLPSNRQCHDPWRPRPPNRNTPPRSRSRRRRRRRRSSPRRIACPRQHASIRRPRMLPHRSRIRSPRPPPMFHVKRPIQTEELHWLISLPTRHVGDLRSRRPCFHCPRRRGS